MSDLNNGYKFPLVGFLRNYEDPSLVSLKQIVMSDEFLESKHNLPFVLGKTELNGIRVLDLTKMPHILMAGASEQGISMGLNVMLISMLYKKRPSQLKFVLFDIKNKLAHYKKLEHHFLVSYPEHTNVIISETNQAISALTDLSIELDQRYKLLSEAGVRSIKGYNRRFSDPRLKPKNGHQFLPYIVVVINELADIMLSTNKEIVEPICRLAQLSRAVGIHLIVTTSQLSKSVITKSLKSNFNVRISFKVDSKATFKTILGVKGAEKLKENSDLVFSNEAENVCVRCPVIDEIQIANICDFIATQKQHKSVYQLAKWNRL